MDSLHLSFASNGLGIVKFLTEETEKYELMKNVTYLMTTKKQNGTHLHIAALNGHIDIVRVFIANLKYSPNIPGQYSCTPLL